MFRYNLQATINFQIHSMEGGYSLENGSLRSIFGDRIVRVNEVIVSMDTKSKNVSDYYGLFNKKFFYFNLPSCCLRR
jgi:hypothetical protein